ncbi:hypothetical protein ABI59_19845 [Acidobacteria bacterium Mor1]|nr:hypothetical protein ABI59_19845 [Acidobacteria bacterium Mor1]
MRESSGVPFVSSHPAGRRLYRVAAWGLAACFATSSLAANLQVFGSLRGMFHQDAVGPQVVLSEHLPDSRLFGVGALSGLRGEITIVGGRLHLAHADGESVRHAVVSRSDESAALLVMSAVERWVPVTIDAAIPFEKLDAEIERLAREAGIEAAAFVVYAEGDLENLDWHVIDGAKLEGGGGSHEDHMRAAIRRKARRTRGKLVGFFSKKHQGVFTHRGANTHFHVVVDEPLTSGHVDGVTIPAGTTLRFSADGT